MREFTIAFIAHLLGDYYLQPESLANKKAEGVKWVLLHCAIYAAVMALSLLALGGAYVIVAAVCAVTHCAIDLVKHYALASRARKGCLTVKGDRTAFVVDQALHIIIMLVASAFVAYNFDSIVPPYLQKTTVFLVRRFNLDVYAMLSYAAIALAVMKPCNVFIKKMLAPEKPAEPDALPEVAPWRSKRAGQLIGILERLLIVLFLVLRQYGAIAIVFTAKSIARFRQLENREFAEYYLTGTLLSVVTACSAYWLIRIFGKV